MSHIQIWHNQSCSKSRHALDFLNKKNINPIIKKYLQEKPTKDEIKNVLKKLNIKAKELIRTNEELYDILNLKDEIDQNKLIDIIFENPILIQRPIIIKGNFAVIARPIEKLEEFLNEL